MKKIPVAAAATILFSISSNSGVGAGERTLKTFVDASSGVTTDRLGAEGGSASIVVFNQRLLDEKGGHLGSNSGFCIRTAPGFSECQWTLVLTDGSITVAGREANAGTSFIPIIGGTGAYLGASGVMATAPGANKTFTQSLTFSAGAAAPQ